MLPMLAFAAAQPSNLVDLIRLLYAWWWTCHNSSESAHFISFQKIRYDFFYWVQLATENHTSLSTIMEMTSTSMLTCPGGHPPESFFGRHKSSVSLGITLCKQRESMYQCMHEYARMVCSYAHIASYRSQIVMCPLLLVLSDQATECNNWKLPTESAKYMFSHNLQLKVRLLNLQ